MGKRLIMALSPSHKFGQIIGDVLEDAIKTLLQDFSDEYGFYLDKKGKRSCRSGNKVTWIDLNGNKHDLDFVIEKNGSDTKIGTPLAFIETAWRRYTKHSRNKAQEIQGAILPLYETYKNYSPFTGTILAGVFTAGALNQLKSLGFSVLYFAYETILKAFSSVGIDASFAENTPNSEVSKKIKEWEKMSNKSKKEVITILLESNKEEVKKFMESLERWINRQIDSIRIFSLHGLEVKYKGLKEAIEYIENYSESKSDRFPILKYEIEILYTNGSKIDGTFVNKDGAINFLKTY